MSKYLIGVKLMRYEKAKKLKDGEFKRLCGVKKETFIEMCAHWASG